jgi:hypothetical protein
VDLRAGPDDLEKRKFLTLPVLELRPLGRPARSQLLYRLRYPGSREQGVEENIWTEERCKRRRLEVHSEELHNLNSSANTFRIVKSSRVGWTGRVAHIEKNRGMYVRFWCENKKGPVGYPKCRWENNIKMDITNIRWCDMDCIYQS